MSGVSRFGKKGKVSISFIRPFEILEWIGELAYRLALQPKLSSVHDVFHVSMLWKYQPDPSHVLDFEMNEVNKRIKYIEESVSVLDWKEQVLQSKIIPIIKVLW